MTAFDRIALFDPRGRPRMVVEVACGSSAKHKFEPELAAFVFERHLPVGLTSPAAWGFFPSTLAEDGDPLDAMLWDEVNLPQGLVIAVEPIALAKVSRTGRDAQTRIRNDRVLVVPAGAEGRLQFSATAREQLADFFVHAARGSGHDAAFEGWNDAEAARRAILEAAAQFERHRRERGA